MDSTSQNSERTLHVRMTEDEAKYVQFLLNRALNTLDSRTVPDFIDKFELNLDNFIHRKPL